MKARKLYVCQACGHQEPKWLGRCPSCEAWSTLIEEAPASPALARGSGRTAVPLAITKITSAAETRMSTGIAELDRVLGGGLVAGSLILVGGDPGIGKSTLLLQAVGKLASLGARALYVTGEESTQQVKMRADRLDVSSDELFLLAETELEAVLGACRDLSPKVLVLDSIQTVGLNGLESPIGSVSQIRGVTQELLKHCKAGGMAAFLVGHVTKDGAIAGPKVMEHMVDTVLYFEGERTGPYRILRAHKNRFGSAQEIGVFEMLHEGLTAVTSPSEIFLAQRASGPGAVVVACLEGTRPILLEVQALTNATIYGTPRRTAIGFDGQRVAMLCAVLERHADVSTNALDVYVNIAGGVEAGEPALDLGVCLALASASVGRALPSDIVVVGEVGLSGEVRGVAQLGARIAEAEALGFRRCLVPQIDVTRWRGVKAALPLHGVASLREALHEVGLGS